MAQTQSLPPVYQPPGYPGAPHHPGAPQYEHGKQTPLQANGQVMQMGSTVQTSGPSVYSGVRDNWQFSLVVEQQPVRARMCGFGDKDRRPITPPPCVRLVITDITTNKEVPADQVDASFFILQVDLWDETGSHEKNVVKAATNSPATSISTATTTSFPPPPERAPIYAPPPPVAYRDPYTGAVTYSHPAPAPYGQPPPHMYSQPSQVPPMYMPAPHMPPPPAGYYAQPLQPAYPPYPGAPHTAMYQPQFPSVMPPQQQTGMFTRNLIGSLTVNAFQLRDPKNRLGHWFILQDLSVRTEGNFRLKMNFTDVGEKSAGGRPGLNHGKCPVLASVFSQPFQVFSAKKFPGVIESTELSKTFAGQGIKIPIRKDGGKPDRDEDDE